MQRYLISHGCQGFLASVMDTSLESPNIENLSVVREFADVFPIDLGDPGFHSFVVREKDIYKMLFVKRYGTTSFGYALGLTNAPAVKSLFLGHIVSADGIILDHQRLRLSTNGRDYFGDGVRSFLGLAGYYDVVVEGFLPISFTSYPAYEKGVWMLAYVYEVLVALGRVCGLSLPHATSSKKLKGTRLCVLMNQALREKVMTEAHSSPFTIHPGSTKMYKDFETVKIEHQRASGLLQPLEIPVWKWDEISMDFITGLPTTQKRHDAIWVVVASGYTKKKWLNFLPIRKNYEIEFTSRFWKGLQKVWGTRLKFSTSFHPQTDGQSERTIQTLEDMLRACALKWTGRWDEYLKCQAPICWDEVGEHLIEGPELIEITNEKVAVAKEKLKEARSRQKSYVDKQTSNVGLKSFRLEMYIYEGFAHLEDLRFGIKGNAQSRFMVSLRIFGTYIREVSYRLALPPQLSHIQPDHSLSRRNLNHLDRQEEVRSRGSDFDFPVVFSLIIALLRNKLKPFKQIATSKPIKLSSYRSTYCNSYALVVKHRVAKDLWEKIKLLMQGTSLTKQEVSASSTPEFPNQDHHKSSCSVFQKGDDLFDAINPHDVIHKTAVCHIAQGDKLLMCWNNKKIHTGALVATRGNSDVFVVIAKGGYRWLSFNRGRRLHCVADPGHPDISKPHQTVSPHNAAYQVDDLDAYDSDCDELNSAKIALIANLSRNGSYALTEVLNPDNLNYDSFNQRVRHSTCASGSQPSGNTKNDRIPQPPSSNLKNKVEAHHRNVKTSLNKKNGAVNVKGSAVVQNLKKQDNSDSICVNSNDCMSSDNLCVSNAVNVVKSRAKSKKHTSKKDSWKPTGKVFTQIGYIWRPTGRTFTIVGNACPLTRITTTNEVPSRKPIVLDSESPKPVVKLVYSRKPRNNTNAESVSKTKVVQIVLWYLDSGCSKHMTGDRSQLTNFVSKFLGTVKFGNDQVAKIMGFGDYQIGNVTISRVYYVEGLGHNLFSVGQFCDSNLEVAFRQHTCFIRNLEGVDLLTGSRGDNLYTLSLGNMMASSPICLLSKASKTKSWLWHRRLSHLNFGSINSLVKTRA
ncbi:integrase, catalytic region, zinc finger, CCHC-type containing protein [Tanacetum coccineum]